MCAMVIVLIVSVINREFESRSVYATIYKIGIGCFSAKDPPGTSYRCHYLYSLVFTGNAFLFFLGNDCFKIDNLSQ